LTAAETLPYRRPAIARETLTKTGFALLALGLLAPPALAFHRTTPPIVAVTSSGDTLLPRVPTEGRQVVVALDVSGRQIFRQHRKHDFLEQITTSGDNANPTISRSSRVIAWDSDCSQLGCPEPGRQIFIWTAGTAFQATHDPTGSSVNPALSGRGTRLAFESRGDLAGANPTGTTQIFLRASDGVVSQASRGAGTSHDAALDHTGVAVVFDSTSDLSGRDTGISQIWFLSAIGFPQIRGARARGWRRRLRTAARADSPRVFSLPRRLRRPRHGVRTIHRTPHARFRFDPRHGLGSVS